MAKNLSIVPWRCRRRQEGPDCYGEGPGLKIGDTVEQPDNPSIRGNDLQGYTLSRLKRTRGSNNAAQ